MEKYAANHFRFTHILDEILDELNLPISRKNEIDLGLGLRKIFGEHVLVNALEKRAHEASQTIVINGIRMDEMEIIKGWGAKIIYVTAPPETRFERYQNRKEKTDDAVMNFQEFKEQENGTELHIPELGKQADYKIENTGSLDDLYKKVEDIIKKL